MTLGELKKDLRKHGIRVVGGVKFIPREGSTGTVTTYFSADQVVFPFKPPGKIYPLVTKTGMDDEEVHSEKIKALKRSLMPDWDEE